MDQRCPGTAGSFGPARPLGYDAVVIRQIRGADAVRRGGPTGPGRWWVTMLPRTVRAPRPTVGRGAGTIPAPARDQAGRTRRIRQSRTAPVELGWCHRSGGAGRRVWGR